MFVATSAGVVYVFTRPRAGWTGTIAASARLRSPDIYANVPAISLAASGSKVVLSDADQNGIGNQCPCNDEIATFTEPARGWYGTVRPTAATVAGIGNGGAVALDGATAFATEGAGVDSYGPAEAVDLYAITSAPSPASSPVAPAFSGSITGLRASRPRLRIRVTAASYQPLLQKVTITLPPGLALSGRGLTHWQGIAVTGGSSTRIGSTARRVTISPPRPVGSLTLVVGRAALRENNTLASAARRASRAHPLRSRVTIRSVDVTGRQAGRTITAALVPR
jgi:hypothetical protein